MTIQGRLISVAIASIPNHSVSVAAAIIDETGHVLLVQRRDSGDWEPPGGFLEIGETIEDGLIREITEETGLIVEPERVTGIYKNMITRNVNITFRCQVSGGQLRESDESSDFSWVAPDDLDGLTTPVFAARMLDAFRTDTPVVRVHNGYVILPSRAAMS